MRVTVGGDVSAVCHFNLLLWAVAGLVKPYLKSREVPSQSQLSDRPTAVSARSDLGMGGDSGNM